MTPPTPSQPLVCEAGSFTCKDAGKRTLEGLSASGTAIRLTVDGSPVVTVTGAGGSATYVGCAFSDSNGPHLCGSTTITSTGASKLTAGDNAVLLSNDTVLSVNLVPAGSGPATVQAGQTRLTAT
jgi:hypothetical protein